MVEVTGPAKTIGKEALDVVIDYFVPLAGGVAGLIIGPMTFGGNSVAGTIWTQANNEVSGATASRLVGALFAGIFGAAGYGFWRLGKRDGWIMKILGKGIGSFFLGTAIGYLISSTLMGKALPSNGLVDKLITGVQSLAQGG
jgi:hypothetical protein